MNTTVLALRVVLATVLAVAGVGKLLDLQGARLALRNFGVPSGAIRTFAPALPTVELLTAVALLIVPSARWGAGAALLLMLAFTAAILRALSFDERPTCHCFGIFYSAPAGWRTVMRNGVLAAMAAFALIEGPGPSLTAWISARSAAELVAIALGILGASLAIAGYYLWRRLVETGRELAAAEAVLAAVPPGLPVNAVAPDFELEEARGGTVSLSDLRRRGAPVLLIFAGRGCMFSWELESDLARWQRTLADRLTIALMSNGRPDENFWQSQTLGIAEVLLQPNAEMARAYRVRGTPSAVVVSEDGRVASPLAQGQAAIEALIRVTLRSEPAEAFGPPAVAHG